MHGKSVRRLIPNWIINYGKHLPEAIFASFLSGFSGGKIRVIGVTGTDGKTTTVNMIFQILRYDRKRCSMISTINASVGNKFYDTGFHVTSPSPWVIQRYLKQAKEGNDEFMILEVTSHALSQFRVWGIPFEIGVITNVTHEHLDYHKTFQNYLLTKAKLIKRSKIAILNRDDLNFDILSKTSQGKIISFGLTREADVNPYDFPINLQLPGKYNLQNALAAAATAFSLGIKRSVVKKALENFSGLSGRMESIPNKLGISIFVDFAHTPNGLEQSLGTLRERRKKSNKLIAVFGAASERDLQKRPLMGEIASRLADIIILTDEDPRFEDSLKIIDEIARGALNNGSKAEVNLFKEPDREKAIKMALGLAKRGDIIGIFGKGHEKSMNYYGEERPWSDTKTTKRILQSWMRK